jgi:hypothetical protein
MMRLFLQERSAELHHTIPSWRKSTWRTYFNRRLSHQHCHSEPQSGEESPGNVDYSIQWRFFAALRMTSVKCLARKG